MSSALWLAVSPLVIASVALPSGVRAKQPRADSLAASISVRDHGARGDGVHDDTAAFQAAVDALPVTGGTVRVPDGTYLIDAARSIRLRSNTRLSMTGGARLVARPNALDRSSVLLVDDVHGVTVEGGSIVGERHAHLGSTGEWGYGISVRGAREVHIRDVHVSACWGDGICIGTIFGRGQRMKVASDITVERVVCSGNRRQGLSITAARRVKVIDSQFIDTGGTLPGCGIDVEPGTIRMGAVDVLISGCLMQGNQGSGIQLYGTNVSRVRLEHCEIRDNHGYGVLISGVTQAVIAHNTIADNGLVGLLVRENVSDCQVAGNTFRANWTRRPKRLQAQRMQQIASHPINPGAGELKVRDGARAVVVSGNTFDP